MKVDWLETAESVPPLKLNVLYADARLDADILSVPPLRFTMPTLVAEVAMVKAPRLPGIDHARTGDGEVAVSRNRRR